MKAIFIPIAPTASDVHAPLRRALPALASSRVLAGSHRRAAWPVALLALAGVALFVNIEFGLAYLLYFVAQLAG